MYEYHESGLEPAKIDERMRSMASTVFYVTIREDYQKAREDYFPHIAASYTTIAKSFTKGKPYPVLAVRHMTMIADDAKNVETSQFLVPTESGNFIWVQSEIFRFAGLNPEDK